MAGSVSVENLAAVLILNFVHATQRTAVAERLPLEAAHLRKRLGFPELIAHRVASMTAFNRRLVESDLGHHSCL